jgi:hypothetical protein
LFYSNKNLKDLEQTINEELRNVSDWLDANKLSLNITKSNFVMFHPPQKRLLFSLNIYIKDKILKERDCIKYLGVMIDTNLRWKEHVNYLNKKIKRSIGLLSKIRYYVDLGCLTKLYHTLIYPFLIYGVVAWGNTYQTIINPLFILQKKAVRIMTFSRFDDPSSSLFKSTKLLKFADIAYLYTSIFMFKYHKHMLPLTFDDFFVRVNEIHHYNTRLSAKTSYSLPKVKTNYGQFNIRYNGPKIWNSLDESIKSLSLSNLKKRLLQQCLINISSLYILYTHFLPF